MAGYSLRSPSVATVPSCLFLSGLIKESFIHGRVLKFPDSKSYPNSGKLRFLNIRAQASGTTKVGAEAVQPISKKDDLKDDNVVFVAGATGRVGSRTVRELLKLGFQVRAGVRSAQKAESLVQSVKQMKLDVENASEGTQRKKRELLEDSLSSYFPAVQKLELVECDLEKRDRILPALGNASVVICCIGASEKEVFDITGPYRIDYLATKNLIDAATVANVKHFILLTSLGTNKFGFPAAILNLFWGVLIWKRKAEEALLASRLPYTIVRPGGMERPTDAYKETHNITLSQEDTLFGGQVSNLQVAELMAFMAKNRSLSYCKVVEVIAETTAPLTPMEKLLAKIPSQRADIYSQKESGAEAGPDSAPPETVKSEKPSLPIEKGPSDAKVTSTQPLSPYIAYEDLKPPTSPSPTPSTTPGATKPSSVDTKPAVLESSPSPPPSATTTEEKPTGTGLGQPRPLSPYTCYEDLKPPSSPSPSLGSSKGTSYPASTPTEVVSPSAGGNDVAKTVATGVVEKVPSQNSTSSYSPYAVYEDLKPPTSPSPTAPNVRLPTSDMDGASDKATLSVNNVPQSPTADKGMDKQHHAGPRPRPLSPFTMYDDLKPPTSPIPSPRRS